MGTLARNCELTRAARVAHTSTMEKRGNMTEAIARLILTRFNDSLRHLHFAALFYFVGNFAKHNGNSAFAFWRKGVLQKAGICPVCYN